MYRSEGTKVSLPEIPDLEDDFDDIMGTLSAKLSSADSQVICKLVGMVRLKYRRYIHGVKPGKVPFIPNTASGLCEFISEKSTPYEILLVHHVVEALDMDDLKRTLQSYESKLGNHLSRTLKSFEKRKVTLPLAQGPNPPGYRPIQRANTPLPRSPHQTILDEVPATGGDHI